MSIFLDLLQAERYHNIIDDFNKKAKLEKHRYHSAPVFKDLNFLWLINNQNYVINKIISALKNKTYAPEPAQLIILPGKKQRKIYSLSWIDKLVDSAFAKVLSHQINPLISSRVFSFRKGLSNIKLIRELSQFIQKNNTDPLYIMKRDVTNYAPSINRQLLYKKLFAVIGDQDSYIHDLLDKFLASFYSYESKIYSAKDLGIPAGYSLSNICENFYLRDLDLELEQLNGFYGRFGDDIIFVTKDLFVHEQAVDILDNKLNYLGLTVKKEKELNLILAKNSNCTFSYKESIDYLGYNVNYLGEIFISKQKLKLLKNEINSAIKKCAILVAKKEKDPELRIKQVVDYYNRHISQDLFWRYYDLIIRQSNNKTQLRALDFWVFRKIIKYSINNKSYGFFKKINWKTSNRFQQYSLINHQNIFRRLR